MNIKQKISDLTIELYTSLNYEDEEYMLVLIDVVEKECLLDNEYLFSIYEIILKWRINQHNSVSEFIQELYDYLCNFE